MTVRESIPLAWNRQRKRDGFSRFASLCAERFAFVAGDDALHAADNFKQQTCFAFSRRHVARALQSIALPSKTKRAQGKPGARCTRGLVCKLHEENAHTSIQVQRRHPAFPAQWFTDYNALSPVTGLSCHRHPAKKFCFPANLTPASGRQDHTASPSARVALVSRNFRVHRIPPRVRDDRDPPLSSGETAGI